MAFSTKLNLSDSKFEQQSGSTLNLDGDTIINTTGSISYDTVPVTPSDKDLVTKNYVDAQIVSGTSSGVTYNLSSPAAVDVGGITTGTVLTGKSSNELLEELLVPTLFPVFTNPSNGFSDNATNTQEVGVTAGTINFTATFDQGSINPQYTASSDKRSGVPNTYNYTGTDLPTTNASTSLSDAQAITDYVITAGANTWTSTVSYDAGVQPKDSVGNDYDSPLGASTTGSQSTTITGIYPYFFGQETTGTRPTANSALVNGYTDKVVASSNGALTIDWDSGSGDYIWFATPSTSATKTTWQDTISAANNGTIGGAVSPGGNLFPALDTVSVTTVLWAGISYKVYISNYQVEQTNPLLLS